MLAKRLKQAREWIDAQGLREQALLAVVALLVIYVMWDFVLVGPLNTRVTTRQKQAQALEKQISEIDGKTQQLMQALHQQSKKAGSGEQVDLSKRIAMVDKHLAVFSNELVSPQDMTKVLKALLQQQHLALINFQVSEAKPFSQQQSGHQLYQHDVQMTLEGSYFNTHAYLEQLETLPWLLFWDAISYQVQQYPNARVNVQMHTISTEPGWIGV